MRKSFQDLLYKFLAIDVDSISLFFTNRFPSLIKSFIQMSSAPVIDKSTNENRVHESVVEHHAEATGRTICIAVDESEFATHGTPSLLSKYL